MKNKVIYILLLGVMFTTLIVGCGNKKTKNETEQIEKKVLQETQSVEENSDTVSEVVTENHDNEVKSYLTGQWIDKKLAKKRPIAVMIENTKMALPQYGLGNADIIYECPVEGGISRLMAIFQDYSNLKKIGNVRSCRHYYAYLAHEYEAMYFYAGASKYAYNGVLASKYINNMDGATGIGGQYYYRDSNKKAPHNLYTASDMITSAIDNMKWETKLSSDYSGHFKFAEDNAPQKLTQGDTAHVIKVYYQNAQPWFEYRDEDKLYYRYEFGTEQIDGNTNSQIAVKNIILQNCKSSIMDKVGRLDLSLFAEGTGKYITNGKCINITWKRNSKDDITCYYDEAGEEIVLNQGKTWVELIQDRYSKNNIIYSSINEFQKKK